MDDDDGQDSVTEIDDSSCAAQEMEELIYAPPPADMVDVPHEHVVPESSGSAAVPPVQSPPPPGPCLAKNNKAGQPKKRKNSSRSRKFSKSNKSKRKKKFDKFEVVVTRWTRVNDFPENMPVVTREDYAERARKSLSPSILSSLASCNNHDPSCGRPRRHGKFDLATLPSVSNRIIAFFQRLHRATGRLENVVTANRDIEAGEVIAFVGGTLMESHNYERLERLHQCRTQTIDSTPLVKSGKHGAVRVPDPLHHPPCHRPYTLPAYVLEACIGYHGGKDLVISDLDAHNIASLIPPPKPISPERWQNMTDKDAEESFPNVRTALHWDEASGLPFVLLYAMHPILRYAKITCERYIGPWKTATHLKMSQYARVNHFLHQKCAFLEQRLLLHTDHGNGLPHDDEVVTLPQDLVARLSTAASVKPRPTMHLNPASKAMFTKKKVPEALASANCSLLSGPVLGKSITKKTRAKLSAIGNKLPPPVALANGTSVKMNRRSLEATLKTGWRTDLLQVVEMHYLGYPVRMYTAPWHTHCHGVLAKKKIPAGMPLCVYAAEVEQRLQNSRSDCVYSLSPAELEIYFGAPNLPQLDLDAHKRGNCARFINDTQFTLEEHGVPRPSNVAQVWAFRDGLPVCIFYATRDIQQGDELLSNYGDDYWQIQSREIVSEHKSFMEYAMPYTKLLVQKCQKYCPGVLDEWAKSQSTAIERTCFAQKPVEYPPIADEYQDQDQMELDRGEYIWEKILDAREVAVEDNPGGAARKMLEYLTKWKNYPPEQNTWERADMFVPEDIPRLTKMLKERLVVYRKESAQQQILREEAKQVYEMANLVFVRSKPALNLHIRGLDHRKAMKYRRCTVCQKDRTFLIAHPLLGVPFCLKCDETFMGGLGWEEKNGYRWCRWCADGGHLAVCSKCSVPFCRDCIKGNIGNLYWSKISHPSHEWSCFVCDPTPLVELQATMAVYMAYRPTADAPREPNFMYPKLVRAHKWCRLDDVTGHSRSVSNPKNHFPRTIPVPFHYASVGKAKQRTTRVPLAATAPSNPQAPAAPALRSPGDSRSLSGATSSSSASSSSSSSPTRPSCQPATSSSPDVRAWNNSPSSKRAQRRKVLPRKTAAGPL